MSQLRADDITNAAGNGAPTFSQGFVGDHAVWLENGNGHGSTNNKIRRFSSATKNVGTAITYADSATLGASLTINETGLYSLFYSDLNTGSFGTLGITKNSVALTTSIAGQADGSTIMALTYAPVTAIAGACSVTVRLVAGDVIRPHDDGTMNSTGYFSMFKIQKVGL